MVNFTPNTSSPKHLKCSHGFFLRVNEDGIDGSRDENDIYIFLMMEFVEAGLVVIKGKAAGQYIAMSKNGELYTTTSSSRPECVFKEICGTECTSYQSMVNPDWYLALTKQGEAKPGPKTKRGQRAVSFMKESLL